jgi:hypothetical protein
MRMVTWVIVPETMPQPAPDKPSRGMRKAETKKVMSPCKKDMAASQFVRAVPSRKKWWRVNKQLIMVARTMILSMGGI